LIVGQATVVMPTLIARRALLQRLGGMDESLTYFDDLDLVLRLAARSEVRASAAVLATIRDYDGRTTSRERPSELFRYKERAYRKAASAARTQSIRLALRRCCAIALVEMAHALSIEGQHDAALDASRRAMLDAPLAPHVWRAVVGSHWRRFKAATPAT
jgi:GT2 family glycosyltransferase